MRPDSHREQIPEKRCYNCHWCIVPEYKRDLLCFHGDEERLLIIGLGIQDGTLEIRLDGKDVGLMDGDEYDAVWGGRVVDDTDVCDEWEPMRFEEMEEPDHADR